MLFFTSNKPMALVLAKRRAITGIKMRRLPGRFKSALPCKLNYQSTPEKRSPYF